MLIESDSTATLNHLGVEVASTRDVADAAARLAGEGLQIAVSEGETCCHATQDKVWVTDPDGEEWEVYTIVDDNPSVDAPATACCA